MNLRKKGRLRRSIEGEWLKKELSRKGLLKREEGQISWVTGLFLILFLAVFLSAALQLERYRAASLYLEDALAASGLASAVVDVEEYGITHEIVIRDINQAFERYQWAVRENLNLSDNWIGADGGVVQGQVRIVNYTVYNVCGQEVMVESFDEEGVHSSWQGTLGTVTAPNGVKIESTSVYGEIAFFVESFPGVKVEAKKGKLIDVVRGMGN